MKRSRSKASGQIRIQQQPRRAIDFPSAVEELLQLYAETEKAALMLPFTGPRYRDRPAGWETKGFWKSVSIGEMPFGAYLRPIVISFLHWHFRNRLTDLRKIILLETRFSELPMKGLIARIDKARDFWRPRITVNSVLFTWLIPLAGPAVALWKWADPHNISIPSTELIIPWLVLSVVYSLLFLAGSFRTKRGLMLGGTGYAASFPQQFAKPGGYTCEREIFGRMHIATSECPFDLILSVAALGFYLVFQFLLLRSNFTSSIGFAPFVGPHVVPFIFALIGIPAAVMAWMSRKKLGRI